MPQSKQLYLISHNHMPISQSDIPIPSTSSITLKSPRQEYDTAQQKKALESYYFMRKLDLPLRSSSVTIQAGFTLVEIMVVVVILAIFASTVTISAGNSESRKNRAYYEYLLNSMDYIRLSSAERMQPMGIRLILNQQGQKAPQVVRLENAYSSYQLSHSHNNHDSTKNNMELSSRIRNSSSFTEKDVKQPSWIADDSIDFPELPNNLTIDIIPLSQNNDQEIQPWFNNQDTPQVIWYGTGQAITANIEIKHNGRLVGNTIQILPDGSTKVGL